MLINIYIIGEEYEVFEFPFMIQKSSKKCLNIEWKSKFLLWFFLINSEAK